MGAFNLTRKSSTIAKQFRIIREIRLDLSDNDILVNAGYYMNCDRASLLDMTDAIDNWADMTTIKDASNRILWLCGDGVIRPFGKAAFTLLVVEIKRKKIVRNAQNIAYANTYIPQLPLPDTHPVFTTANWPGH